MVGKKGTLKAIRALLYRRVQVQGPLIALPAHSFLLAACPDTDGQADYDGLARLTLMGERMYMVSDDPS